MAIATATFISDIILFIRDFLRTNITDPAGKSSENFVFTAYPKVNVSYPIITVRHTGIKTEKLGMQSEIHDTTLDIEIRVWARNAKELDRIVQEIIVDLKNAEFGASGTSESEIFGFVLESAVPVVLAEGDNMIHSSVLTFKYRAILDN